MTTFTGDFAFGCKESECVVFIHRVVKTEDRGIVVVTPLHKRKNGSHFYDAPDGHGGFVRMEVEA